MLFGFFLRLRKNFTAARKLCILRCRAQGTTSPYTVGDGVFRHRKRCAPVGRAHPFGVRYLDVPPCRGRPPDAPGNASSYSGALWRAIVAYRAPFSNGRRQRADTGSAPTISIRSVCLTYRILSWLGRGLHPFSDSREADLRRHPHRCPRCGAQALYQGSRTVCSACGWEAP